MLKDANDAQQVQISNTIVDVIFEAIKRETQKILPAPKHTILRDEGRKNRKITRSAAQPVDNLGSEINSLPMRSVLAPPLADNQARTSWTSTD